VQSILDCTLFFIILASFLRTSAELIPLGLLKKSVESCSKEWQAQVDALIYLKPNI